MNTNEFTTYKNIVLNAIRNYSIAGLDWKETFTRVSSFLCVLHITDTITLSEFEALRTYATDFLDTVFSL